MNDHDNKGLQGMVVEMGLKQCKSFQCSSLQYRDLTWYADDIPNHAVWVLVKKCPLEIREMIYQYLTPPRIGRADTPMMIKDPITKQLRPRLRIDNHGNERQVLWRHVNPPVLGGHTKSTMKMDKRGDTTTTRELLRRTMSMRKYWSHELRVFAVKKKWDEFEFDQVQYQLLIKFFMDEARKEDAKKSEKKEAIALSSEDYEANLQIAASKTGADQVLFFGDIPAMARFFAQPMQQLVQLCGNKTLLKVTYVDCAYQTYEGVPPELVNTVPKAPSHQESNDAFSGFIDVVDSLKTPDVLVANWQSRAQYPLEEKVAKALIQGSRQSSKSRAFQYDLWHNRLVMIIIVPNGLHLDRNDPGLVKLRGVAGLRKVLIVREGTGKQYLDTDGVGTSIKKICGTRSRVPGTKLEAPPGTPTKQSLPDMSLLSAKEVLQVHKLMENLKNETKPTRRGYRH